MDAFLDAMDLNYRLSTALHFFRDEGWPRMRAWVDTIFQPRVS